MTISANKRRTDQTATYRSSVRSDAPRINRTRESVREVGTHDTDTRDHQRLFVRSAPRQFPASNPQSGITVRADKEGYSA